MKKLLIILLLSFNIQVKAQISVKDTLTQYLQEDARFVLSLHNRNMYLLGEKIRMYGVIAGFDYSKKMKLYLGYYGFENQNPTTLINSSQFPNDTVIRSLASQNLSAGLDYTFFKKNRLSLSVPVQIGIGTQSENYVGDSISKYSNIIKYVPIETGINGYFSIFSWAGIKGGVGYRLNLGKKEALNNSSPYFNLGLAILLGELYREVF